MIGLLDGLVIIHVSMALAESLAGVDFSRFLLLPFSDKLLLLVLRQLLLRLLQLHLDFPADSLHIAEPLGCDFVDGLLLFEFHAPHGALLERLHVFEFDLLLLVRIVVQLVLQVLQSLRHFCVLFFLQLQF